MQLIPPGKRKNRYWNVRFQTADGTHHEISTGEADKRAARRAANELVAKVSASAKSKKGRPRTFREVAEVYAAARNVTKDTERYLAWLNASPLGDMRVEDIRPADVLAVASSYGGENSTRNRKVIVPAAAVLHFAAEQEWCTYRKLKKLPEKEPPMRRVAARDMQRLIAAAEGPLQKFLILVYGQGWRIGEALSLQREQVDFETSTARVWVSKVGKWKRVMLAPEVHVALATGDWYGAEQWAFPWRYRNGVYRELRALCERVGVRFTPHMARHAFGSELGEGGAGLKDLLALGTWTDPKSVLRYQHPGGEHLRAMLRRRGKTEKVS